MKQPAHVLMLDPDIRLVKVYAAALRVQGYEVAAVTTAQDAVTAADEKRPDLVLLELQLVAHSGLEFLYELRSYADWRDVPVVVLSDVLPDRLEASKQLLYGKLGVKAYLYKPQTTLERLLSTVSVYVAAQTVAA